MPTKTTAKKIKTEEKKEPNNYSNPSFFGFLFAIGSLSVAGILILFMVLILILAVYAFII